MVELFIHPKILVTKVLLSSFLLLFFLLVLCSFSYPLLKPFLSGFLICSVQCTLSSNNRIIKKSWKALKSSTWKKTQEFLRPQWPFKPKIVLRVSIRSWLCDEADKSNLPLTPLGLKALVPVCQQIALMILHSWKNFCIWAFDNQWGVKGLSLISHTF